MAWRAALDAREPRIVVSREEKWLWLMHDDSVLLVAPVAVGRDTVFHYGGTAYDFSTPTGRMTVQGKEEEPEWVPPDWHYFEKAVEDDLEPVHLKDGDVIELSDSTTIEVRDGEVGRVNRFGYWRAFTPGSEIIFDGRIFVPPLDSPQRRIPKVLGTHRLILGDGYLIHGTPEEHTIGEEASHGCVRMFNRDVRRLYALVEPGTPVFVY
ncbi:MAG: L,D-transpeptidase [Gemmatimonadota bacterium]